MKPQLIVVLGVVVSEKTLETHGWLRGSPGPATRPLADASVNTFHVKAFTQQECHTKLCLNTSSIVVRDFPPQKAYTKKKNTVTQCGTTHVKGIQNVNVDVCVLESKLGARGSIQSELNFYNTESKRERERERERGNNFLLHLQLVLHKSCGLIITANMT